MRAMSAGGWAKQGGGFYSFEHGHLLLWTNWAKPRRPAELEPSGGDRGTSSARRRRNGWSGAAAICACIRTST